MYWIFSVKLVDLRDSCTVGGNPAMNIIIAWVPVLNVTVPEQLSTRPHLGQPQLLLPILMPFPRPPTSTTCCWQSILIS